MLQTFIFLSYDIFQPAFLTRLAQLGFTVTLFENPEGEHSHVFLVRKGSPLHLVVLHTKSAGKIHIRKGKLNFISYEFSCYSFLYIGIEKI